LDKKYIKYRIDLLNRTDTALPLYEAAWERAQRPNQQAGNGRDPGTPTEGEDNMTSGRARLAGLPVIASLFLIPQIRTALAGEATHHHRR
jgi:hypothetical protein